MKILITVEFYYAPGGGGMQEQARRIAEGLASKGHEVIVATSFLANRDETINGVTIKSFKASGNIVKGMKGEIEAYRNFLINEKYDVLINFAGSIWTTDVALQNAHLIQAKKILSTPGMSKMQNPKYRAYYESVYIEGLKSYDKIFYTSAHYHDKKFGDEHELGDKAIIIPNAAGDEFLEEHLGFKKKYGIETKHMLLTVANHYFAKGHGFVLKAFRGIKRRDTTLVIIGQKPGNHSWYSCYFLCKAKALFSRRIRVLGNVSREDVISAYQEADLFLFGSKLECAPLVMYESFAARTPFITRDVGNVQDHKDLIKIIETPQDMAHEALVLLHNKEKRLDMANKAFELWKVHHRWENVINKYEEVLNGLANGV